MIVATSTGAAVLVTALVFSTLVAGVVYAIEEFGRIITQLEAEDSEVGAGAGAPLEVRDPFAVATLMAVGADNSSQGLVRS